jgi:hypothetical protein
MATTWYFRSDGQTHGPFTSKELRAAAREGRFGPIAEVRTADSPDWHRAVSITGLEFGGQTMAVREAIEHVAGDILAEQPLRSGVVPPPQADWKDETISHVAIALDEMPFAPPSDNPSLADDPEFIPPARFHDDAGKVPEYRFILALAAVTEVVATIVASLAIIVALVIAFMPSSRGGRWGEENFVFSLFQLGFIVVPALLGWLFYFAVAQLMRLFVQTAHDAHRTRVAIERLASSQR